MPGGKRQKPKATELKKSIKSLPLAEKEIAEKLLYRMEFIEDTLDELEQRIQKDGAVITAVNGNGFETTTEHPAQKSYNIMIGKYNALVKTLMDMLPKEDSESDLLMEFLAGAK